MDDHHTGLPADEAYGRVTDAARYSVLHDAARELLDQISSDYAVEVSTGPTVDEDLAGRTPTETTVRVQPSTGGGAPLTVAFTAFPGLIVRFGTWQVEAYPLCGCDACDEQPADLIERLRRQVPVIVSEGFTESSDPRLAQIVPHDGSRRIPEGGNHESRGRPPAGPR